MILYKNHDAKYPGIQASMSITLQYIQVSEKRGNFGVLTTLRDLS
jgi:hypothetical protein